MLHTDLLVWIIMTSSSSENVTTNKFLTKRTLVVAAVVLTVAGLMNSGNKLMHPKTE